LYVFITLIIVLLKKKSLPFLYVYAFFWGGGLEKKALVFSVRTAAGQNSSMLRHWESEREEGPLFFLRTQPQPPRLASELSKAS